MLYSSGGQRSVTDDSLKVLLLLVALCLLGGVLAGIALGGYPSVMPVPTVMPYTPPPISSPTANRRVSVLLLGVDSVSVAAPRLEACWALTFNPGESEYFLVGFSPAARISLSGHPAATLQAAFQADQELQLQRYILEGISQLSPGLTRPEVTALFDGGMLATGIDMLGGITLQGQLVNGPGALAQYASLAPEDYAGRLQLQYDILQAMQVPGSQISWSLNSLQAFLQLGQRWLPDQQAALRLARQQVLIPNPDFHITVVPFAPTP